MIKTTTDLRNKDWTTFHEWVKDSLTLLDNETAVIVMFSNDISLVETLYLQENHQEKLVHSWMYRN